MTRTAPPTGEKITSEVEHEMQDRLYPLRHLTLAPAEYHVYLHPDDYGYVREIVPRIVEDAQAALNSLVQRLNTPAWWHRLQRGQVAKPIEVPPGGWIIYIKPAINNEVNAGELGIHSRLAVPSGARFGTGAGTVRIAETVVSGTARRTVTRTETLDAGRRDPTVPEAAGDSSASAAPDVTASEVESPSVAGGSVPVLPRTVTVSGPRLLYRDDIGEHVYPITKDLTKVGRGGADHWVDVLVSASPHVSREHCVIRCDADGRFYLRDVSACGTTVNGSAVQRAADGSPAQERELAHGDTVRLAESVTLQLLLR